MKRRELLQLSLVGAAATAAGQSAKEKAAAPGPFEFAGKGLRALQADMKSGQLTAVQLTQAYLKRIEALNPMLRAVIEVNPEAASVADALDTERKEKGSRGFLHGIPVLIKDNVDTGDKLQTTAGSLALVGAPAKKDAFVVKKLRDAGAIILGKANMSEWANIRSSTSTSGWSARGGQGRNPYALDRSPIGSSSGSGAAVAADLCAVALGTETNGSIVAPASAMGVVGLKPTVGAVSRTGVIPISHSQDTVGPMGRSVEDVAFTFTAMTGFDPDDFAMRGAGRKVEEDYARGFDREALRGKRLGVVRELLSKGLLHQRVMQAALKTLEKLGATLVDVALPSLEEEAQMEVLLTELKADLNAYLKSRGPESPVKSLAEIIAFNEKNSEREMPFFGQELLVQSESKGPLTSPKYVRALEQLRLKSRKEGIDSAVAKNKLDALVGCALEPAWLLDPVLGDAAGGLYGGSHAAIAGYPSLSVPCGMVGALPVGLLFFGPAWSDGTLLKFGYAFEQASASRVAPTFAASVTPRF